MGLDMYLHGTNKVVDSAGFTAKGSEQLAYWRKSNQIHGWFSRLHSTDSLGSLEVAQVTIPQLKELVKLCEDILGIEHGADIEELTTLDSLPSFNLEMAEQDLPTVEGFFFGSYGYNEHYIEDLIHTIKQLRPVIEADKYQVYYYYSWW